MTVAPANGQQHSAPARSPRMAGVPSCNAHAMPAYSLPGARQQSGFYFSGLASLIVVLAYMEGLLIRFGLDPMLTKLAIEAPLLLLAGSLISITRGQKPAPGWQTTLLFVVWTLFAGIMSGAGFYVSFLWARHVVYAYVAFALSWSGVLSLSQVMKLIRLVAILWLAQVGYAAYEVFVLGQRNEATVGTMVEGGGGLANDFSLFAMVFTMSVFLFHNRKMMTGALAISFLLVAYASSKRSVYFYAPAFLALMAIEYLIAGTRLKGLEFSRLLKLCLLLLACLPLYFYGLSHSAGIGDAPSDVISKTDRVRYAVEYAHEYTTKVTEDGLSMGRTATSLNVLKRSRSSGWFIALFGVGPGAFREELGDMAASFFRIGYGCSGWAADTISSGWPGLIARLLFIFSIWSTLLKAPLWNLRTFWQAMAFAAHTGFLMLLVFYFTYSYASIIYPQTLFVLFFAAGILSSPRYRHSIMRPMPLRRAPFSTHACKPRTYRSV